MPVFTVEQCSQSQEGEDASMTVQGFDGHYVRYNPRSVGGLGGFDIAPEAGIPRVQRQLMLRICELGWLFR